MKYELKEEVLLTQFQNKWEGIKETINRDKKFKLYIATTALVKQFLFCWDTVHINGSERLLRFLMDDLDIDWAKDARILISEVYKTIRIFNDHEKSIEIDVNAEKEAILKISNGRTHDLTVKKENGQLNVYAKKFTRDIEHIIKAKLGIEPLNIYPLIGKPYLVSGWDYARNEPKGNQDILLKAEKEDLNKLIDGMTQFASVGKEKLNDKLVIVSDDLFTAFVTMTTEIVARTKIDAGTGTVQQGALWYEEY